MGGRGERREFADRETWIQDVSDSRLDQYERMLDSAGRVQRVDGDSRSTGTQSYFRDLIERERSRRS